MATTSLCKVDGCGKTMRSHGLCGGHLYRMRKHGDPLKGRAHKGEPQRFLTDYVLTYQGDDCLFWPYGRSKAGYGVLRHEGRAKTVHRLVCTEIHGPPPASDAEASHLCGQGHLGCVNARHLRWESHAENMAKMVEHGRSNRGEIQHMAKLTEDDVRYIRSVGGAVSNQYLAEKFGVHSQTISDAFTGRNWAWVE